jgi:hypothetical protein
MLTAADLADLLADPSAPTAAVHGARDELSVRASDLLAFVNERAGERTVTSAELEMLMKELGGHRRTVTSLDDLPRRLVRRMLRRADPEHVDQSIYVFPRSILSGAERPKNALPPRP